MAGGSGVEKYKHSLGKFAVSLVILLLVYLFLLYKTLSVIGMQMAILAYISIGVLTWYFGYRRGLLSSLAFYITTAFMIRYYDMANHPIQILLGLVSFFVISGITGFVSSLYYELRETKRELSEEHRKNELLLENILPHSIAKRLKDGEKLIADRYNESTILFFDLVGFTTLASKMDPHDVVKILDDIIRSFDNLVDTLHLEKIKTIGDAYLVVSGLPEKRRDHAHAIADMALAMRRSFNEVNQRLGLGLQMRIGIHSGPVVGGVIGEKKFTFDLWGDTVNIASRMESHGLPGEIQVSEVTYSLLKNDFEMDPRGEIEMKNRGTMKTWILNRRNAQ